jgi:hypothetical protein
MKPVAMLRQLARRLALALRQLLVPIVLLLNGLGLIGFYVRDRSVLLAFLLYLPLIPLGVCSVGLGLGLRRSISRRLRTALVVLGVVSTVTASSWMFGRGPGPSSAEAQSRTLSLLHWNVQWGRYWNSAQNEWKAMVTEIVGHNPDILVLSEAPPYYGMYQALDRLPGRRFVAFLHSDSADRRTY